jgi:hypothetical protein
MTERGRMRHLKTLEQDANTQPEDAYRQLRFLQELNKQYPALVIRRVEENRFAVDEAVQKEYIKALVKCVALCWMGSSLFVDIEVKCLCGNAFVEPAGLTRST